MVPRKRPIGEREIGEDDFELAAFEGPSTDLPGVQTRGDGRGRNLTKGEERRQNLTRRIQKASNSPEGEMGPKRKGFGGDAVRPAKQVVNVGCFIKKARPRVKKGPTKEIGMLRSPFFPLPSSGGGGLVEGKRRRKKVEGK